MFDPTQMCSSSISPLGLFQGLRGWKKGPWNPELLGEPKLEEELIWRFFWTNLNFHGIKFLDSYFKIYLQIVKNSKKLESILTFLSFLYKKNCDKVKNPLLFSSTPPFLENIHLAKFDKASSLFVKGDELWYQHNKRRMH